MVRILIRNSVTTVTILLVSLVSGCAPVPQAPAPPLAGPALGTRAAALLSESIRIRTVSPPGDERPLAELLVGRLRDAGIEANVIETPRGSSQVGRAAAWGMLRGSRGRKPIVLLSHLDVVPADPADWTVDPFAGVLEQGYVMGRGALDAKGVAVVHLLTADRAGAPRDPALARRDLPRHAGRGDGRGRRRGLPGPAAPRPAARRRLSADGGRRHPLGRRAPADLGHRRHREDALLAAHHGARHPGSRRGSGARRRGPAPDRRARARAQARDAGARGPGGGGHVPRDGAAHAGRGPRRLRRPRRRARVRSRLSRRASCRSEATPRWSATRSRSPCSRAAPPPT